MSELSCGILERTAERFLGARGHSLSRSGGTGYRIILKLDEALKNDRYIIIPGENTVVLSAGNDRSLHAAFGRWLEESSFDGRGGFVPACERIDHTPKDELRGIYFATHFYNFYHSAPLEEVYDVIDDLALRGCNSLLVWFDMHHFDSMDDPDAMLLADRLRAILKHANDIGIGGSLTMLSNEGFKSSPVSLRAEWTAQNGYITPPLDHYHVELCPSKKGGIEEIIRERRQMLERFADLKIDYICYWPYDQGGCTCIDCAPWGANGFMKLYPAFKDLVSELMPETKIIISTWYFDKYCPGEWDAFYQKIGNGLPEGASYIMSFFFNGEMPPVLNEKGIPEGVKFIDFPEISMYSCTPWGGFGASALPGFLERTNEKSGMLYSGGFPYSEGIFEDLNKYISLTYYSGRFENTSDAVRAYVKQEFCVDGDAADELTEAILMSEKTLPRERVRKEGEPLRVVIADTGLIPAVFRIFSKYDRLLPEAIRRGSKFRLWYLRALIDKELLENDGYPIRSGLCQSALEELLSIYHAVPGLTHRWVCPPAGL